MDIKIIINMDYAADNDDNICLKGLCLSFCKYFGFGLWFSLGVDVNGLLRVRDIISTDALVL